MKEKVWLVEIWNPKREQWEPTTTASLTYAEGLICRYEWMEANPDDRFRVMSYTR